MLSLELTQFETSKLVEVVRKNEMILNNDNQEIETIVKQLNITPYTIIPSMKTLLYNMILNIKFEFELPSKPKKKSVRQKLLALT